MEQSTNRRPRVMINPSAQFDNVVVGNDGEELYNEAHVMFDIALLVSEELRRDGRVEPFVSRETREQRITLRQETELARELNCRAFVALHSDATGKPDDPGGGTWSFYADEEGKRLAECVQTPLLEAIREVHPEVVFRGVRTHWNRLWVLHENNCPAALVEILFHSNPNERELIRDASFQRRTAKAVARGILDFLGLD